MKKVAQFLALTVFSNAMAAVDYSASLEQKARSGDHQAQMDLRLFMSRAEAYLRMNVKRWSGFRKPVRGDIRIRSWLS